VTNDELVTVERVSFVDFDRVLLNKKDRKISENSSFAQIKARQLRVREKR
jgi:hypothetical protein